MAELLDWDQLDRYFAGELGEEETAQLRRWLMAHPDEARLLDVVTRELDGTRGLGDVTQADALASWHMLPARMGGGTAARAQGESASAQSVTPFAPDGLSARGPRPFAPHRERVARRSLWGATFVLAAALAVVVAMLFPYQFRSTPTTAFNTYATTSGERASIVLIDGTRVNLNVASRLEVPKNFGEGNRSVRLIGEAYFQVTHTAGAPFTVAAGRTRTTVLGTAFGIQAYQPADVQVAVRAGKITLNNVVLTARDIAHATPAGVVVAHDQSLDAALAFVTGRLLLPRTQLRDAIVGLNRWYGADIRLGDPALGALPIQGVLLSGSIGDLMELLHGTLDVRVVRTGRTLTLYPR